MSEFCQERPLSGTSDGSDQNYNNKGNPVFSCPVPVVPPPTTVPPYRQPQDDYYQGYNQTPVHPMYRTTSSNYGARAPSVHTMPLTFHAKSQEFSNQLGKCGMYRNSSLNTGLDSTNTPDHWELVPIRQIIENSIYYKWTNNRSAISMMWYKDHRWNTKIFYPVTRHDNGLLYRCLWACRSTDLRCTIVFSVI